MAQWLLTSLRKCHNPLAAFLWNWQYPLCVINGLYLKMRLFIFVFLSRIVFFLLFLTSSSSSQTKQIIAAATHLFTILFFFCVCRVVRRVVRGVAQTVQTCLYVIWLEWFAPNINEYLTIYPSLINTSFSYFATYFTSL